MPLAARSDLLGRDDRRLPLAGQVVEAVGVDQRIVELAALKRRLSSAPAIGAG